MVNEGIANVVVDPDYDVWSKMAGDCTARRCKHHLGRGLICKQQDHSDHISTHSDQNVAYKIQYTLHQIKLCAPFEISRPMTYE